MTGSQLHQLTAGLAGVVSGTGLDGVPFVRPTVSGQRKLGDVAQRWRGVFTDSLYLHELADPGSFTIPYYAFTLMALTAGGAVTLTLPLSTSSQGQGRVLCVKRIGANLATVQAQGGELIDGAGALVLGSDGAAVILQAVHFGGGVFGWAILSSS